MMLAIWLPARVLLKSRLSSRIETVILYFVKGSCNLDCLANRPQKAVGVPTLNISLAVDS